MSKIHPALDTIKGLTAAAAAARLATDGPNELPAGRRRGMLDTVRDVLREPMFLLLVACGSLYFILGDVQEGCMLMGFVFVIIGITVYQERKTEHALEALRDLSSPRALVIRDGNQQRIPGHEVVRGDVIIVSEGDRIPADARLTECVNLAVDESMLTGESVPVRKHQWDGTSAATRPGGDDLPSIYSGSLVVSGWGVAEVQETAGATEMGKIGKALQSVETENTRLQKDTAKLVRTFAIIGLSACVVCVIVFTLCRGDFMQGLLAGIALAMATLPEEFPVVLTIFMALGAWRMSRHHVLTRRMAAVETLGATTVLCTDKTGTLTQNRMTVVQLCDATGNCWVAGDKRELPEPFHRTMEYGALASQHEPYDPMEKAIRGLAREFLTGTEHEHADWELVRQYPLSRELLAISHVWKSPDGRAHTVASKGAPEAILDLCHLPEARRTEILARVTDLANQGLRVLGVARADFTPGELPEQQHAFAFTFLGLIGLEDPVRPTVPGAIRECYDAGIRVVMITGDYPGTARKIAETIGLRTPDRIITGPELDAMDDATLTQRVRDVAVFARVVPEQKLRIVNAFKAAGEVVAMTGDGVNDAPALKSAHIGVAMGERGTDVAREASAIVLTDDDFASIVRAVRMGRRIYDNIRKAMTYILSVHVPIAGMSMLPIFYKEWPLILLPVHIVFLELIIDPACSVAFEAEKEEHNIMNRPPRSPQAPLFSGRDMLIALAQGGVVLLLTVAVFLMGIHRGLAPEDTRSLTFATLVVSNIGLILVNRSWTLSLVASLRISNRAFWWVLGGASSMLLLAVYTPVLQRLFHFQALHAADWGICLGAGFTGIVLIEFMKRLHRTDVPSARVDL